MQGRKNVWAKGHAKNAKKSMKTQLCQSAAHHRKCLGPNDYIVEINVANLANERPESGHYMALMNRRGVA
jgi:hypothetical protein